MENYSFSYAPTFYVRRSTQDVINQAVSTVDREYSYSGDAINDPAAELYLPYHNGVHTRNVCYDVELGAQVVGLVQSELEVALAAGSAHDVVQELDGTGGKNEKASAEWLVNKMESKGIYSSLQIEMARLAIAGTRCFIDMDHVMHQLATGQDYPTKRAELIGHVVASADLGRLYTLDGPYLSHKLFQERTTGGSGIKPSLDALTEFQLEQVRFLNKGYKYPNTDIGRVLTARIVEVNTYSEGLLNDLEAGRIESWDEILQRDLEFMKSA